MPGMTGIEAVEKLRENEQTAYLPVIMLTARNFEFGKNESDKLKISEFVGKPFSPRELLKKVEEVLNRQQTMAANHS
jgi:DNA-binding response OmpR family regulator